MTHTTPPNLLNLTTQGHGPPLVLIHGVAGSLHIWDPIVTDLAKDYQVSRVDLLGYGHSPKPQVAYTPQVHVEAIRATLHTNGLQPPYTLIGLSMGVNLALEYAARWPEEVNGFIGIGLPYYPTESAARKGLHNNIWARLTLEHPLLARVIIPPIWWLGRHKILPAGNFTRIYSPLMAQDTLLNPYYVFRSSLWNCMVKNPQTELLQKSSHLHRLFIHGEKDEWAAPTQVERALKPYKKSTFTVIPGMGHNVVVLEPTQTIRLIRDYLSNLRDI